ncbi:MAG: type II toxin-antitoxin system VapC family toxin [Terriglobales bacterium]
MRITELAIQTISTSNLLIQAFQIAVDYDRSFYDSLYVALALTAKTQLITADERLVKALGSRFPIRWLGTF